MMSSSVFTVIGLNPIKAELSESINEMEGFSKNERDLWDTLALKEWLREIRIEKIEQNYRTNDCK
jgi:hypothetical protein